MGSGLGICSRNAHERGERSETDAGRRVSLHLHSDSYRTFEPGVMRRPFAHLPIRPPNGSKTSRNAPLVSHRLLWNSSVHIKVGD